MFLLTFSLLFWIIGAATALRAQEGGPLTIVALGDSLTAGYQLPAGAGFAERLEQVLRERGHEVTVINAGVSGDTSSGGLSRLGWAVPDTADAVIVQLGANDALRGVEPETTRANLDRILGRLSEAGHEILLVGMYAPPNLGRDYEEAFNGIYPALAERYGTVFYPFFLDGVAADPGLNLPDGIHPNEEGIRVIVARILPYAEDLIARVHEERAETGVADTGALN